MSMLVQSVLQVLTRDLERLRNEVEQYPTEADLWKDIPGITNPGGVLAAHCAGNLRHFVGGLLGGSGYVRDRAAEFSRRDRSRAELLEGLSAAEREVGSALARLPESALAKEFPETVGGMTRSTGDQLVVLVAHLAYHLGQVNYHRRVVSRR
jgi:hypothetical protein